MAVAEAVNVQDDLHVWVGLKGADEARAWVEHHLAASRAEIAALLAVAGARTVELTSRPSRQAANRLYQRMGFEARETNVYRYDLPAR